MPRLRRTQTIYVTLDPFLSPRGKVLHRFEQFLSAVFEADFPCIWLTSLTRAQLDEPRRRLGHRDPFIGESGGGVYLPEDYFHLKSRDTVRMGRFTCVPIAKPQPAAADALENLSAETGTPVVPLRSLSLRELSQNTGLPGSEAEHIRMRDFDELFFFAGADQAAISRFQQEAESRGLSLQNVGPFWSLSVGADAGKCIRELGGLYDRALRTHALRVGVATIRSADDAIPGSNSILKTMYSACDRVILLAERQPGEQPETQGDADAETDNNGGAQAATRRKSPQSHAMRRSLFHLHSPNVWDEVLETILARA